MEKKTSTRIIFFGFKAIIFGLALIVAPFVWIKATLLLSLLCLIAGIYFIICGVGILLHKDWARKAIVYIYFCLSVLCLAMIVMTLLYFFPESHRLQFSLVFIFLLLWFLASGYYFNRPKIKEQFK